MQIKVVFVEELSRKIKIVEAERKEISQELAVLDSLISQGYYMSWVLETFLVGMGSVMELIMDTAAGKPSKIEELRQTVYKQIIKVNPLLDPEELYVSDNNTLTLNKTSVKLTSLSSWPDQEEDINLAFVDFNNYYKIVENAKEYDHELETEKWDLFENMFVNIRKYSKSLKINLMQGQRPETDSDAKYFVVATCIDNFPVLYNFVTDKFGNSGISLTKIIDSLFELAIKYNPFLNVKAKDFKKINKTYKHYKQGTSIEQPSSQPNLRKSLSAMTKKEVIGLEDSIKREIFGHNEAISAVCNSVKRAYMGIKDPKSPVGAFFFYGATSTGKTELAKVLAKKLTRSIEGLVKISCSTLQSPHSIYTLTGSPPGYVGYEDQGLLSKVMKNSKFKVILFDEVEKATPKLFDVILDILEEGELMMSNGTVVDLSEAVIILTSNIGQQEANKRLNATGFTSKTNRDAEEAKILQTEFDQHLKEKLRPEFLARLNSINYFRKLTEEELTKSAHLKLQKYTKLLQKRKIRLLFDKQLAKHVVDQCAKERKDFHARDVRNFIDMNVMKRLGDFILGLELAEKQDNYINISVKEDDIVFELIPNEEPLTNLQGGKQ